MKCYRCGEKEADVLQDCLIVQHVYIAPVVGAPQFAVGTSQKNGGIETIGLCPECLQKQEKDNRYIRSGLFAFSKAPIGRKAFCGIGLSPKDLEKESPILFENITVPLGAELYRDKADFIRSNRLLRKNAAEVIYRDYITGDKWKEIKKAEEKAKAEAAAQEESGSEA